ncbi:MAG: hypothetical protein MI924_32210 [Chloroflexales bacterium]|nr:hypothetical protein [Chloroflexales bacterium]
MIKSMSGTLLLLIGIATILFLSILAYAGGGSLYKTIVSAVPNVNPLTRVSSTGDVLPPAPMAYGPDIRYYITEHGTLGRMQLPSPPQQQSAQQPQPPAQQPQPPARQPSMHDPGDAAGAAPIVPPKDGISYRSMLLPAMVTLGLAMGLCGLYCFFQRDQKEIPVMMTVFGVVLVVIPTFYWLFYSTTPLVAPPL